MTNSKRETREEIIERVARLRAHRAGHHWFELREQYERAKADLAPASKGESDD